MSDMNAHEIMHSIPASPQNENDHETHPPEPGELPPPGEERGPSRRTPAETHDSGNPAGTNQIRPSTNRTQRSQSHRDSMTMKDVIKEVESPVKAAEQSKRQVYQNLAAVPPSVRWSKLPTVLLAFIPFAVDSIGTVGSEALSFLKKIVAWYGNPKQRISSKEGDKAVYMTRLRLLRRRIGQAVLMRAFGSADKAISKLLDRAGFTKRARASMAFL
ncbi:hypothetical protein ADUPG1_012050 [Aduncisulcus paluster]|uniref:Uncharacterized protein n=1 Tax=Aduncisulcus paluster TaxID=2918883 RepID=A0ABQ5K0C1_9EUKA|nr:hypothetical protein ADUPG1_012050 [Aduncisulcus paluster]